MMEQNLITIVTPSFNRLHTLDRLHSSLLAQTEKDFVWHIVDDGSSDGTQDWAGSLKGDKSLNIIYSRQENAGKHVALNRAFAALSTKYVMVVDSDDFLESNAIETVARIWAEHSNDENIGAVWFPLSDKSGGIIGEAFPTDGEVSTYVARMINSPVAGDKCVVYRTELLKDLRFPVFANEKFFGEGWLHKQASIGTRAVFSNRRFYVADYQRGGLTDSGRSLRFKNPQGMHLLSKAFLTPDVSVRRRTMYRCRYLVYGLLAGKSWRSLVLESDERFATAILLPLCLSLSLLIEKYAESSAHDPVITGRNAVLRFFRS